VINIVDILNVSGLNFSWGKKRVLEDINFRINSNEVVSILGINGAGKSTLIKCLNGILKPNKGKIEVISKPEGAADSVLRDLSSLDLVSISKTSSYVPQSIRSSFSMDVFDVVLLGRRPHLKWRISESDRDKVSDTLRYLDLEDFAFRKFDKLSGGERQRVLIAKAIAQDPNLYLFDEPTSDLDLRNQIQIMKCIRNLISESDTPKSALIAIHDINIAARYSDRIILLDNGSIKAFGPPSEVLTVENIADVFGVSSSISYESGNYIRIVVNDEIKESEE
tara:strand:- start:4 stop:840 length:837 start_codon:yes stop_codon:yes gene_type:complete